MLQPPLEKLFEFGCELLLKFLITLAWALEDVEEAGLLPPSAHLIDPEGFKATIKQTLNGSKG